MTTIAYRDGWLVSESRSSTNTYIDSDRTKKIFKLPKGAYMAMSGNWVPGLRLFELTKQIIASGRGELPNVKFPKCMAIVAFKNGMAALYEDGMWFDLDKWKYPYAAIGTGTLFALAAMDAGATAEEAVRIAVRRDLYSGGRIQKVKVS